MKTYIICGFPGCGKSTVTADLLENTPLKVIDLDSSNFDKDEFPKNYISKIRECMGKYDIIFISAHRDVRIYLEDEKIPFIYYFPSYDRRQEFIINLVKRRSNQSLIQKIDNNFDKWVKDAERDNNDYCQRIRLKEKGQYIANEQHFVDLVNEIISSKGNE